MTAIELYREIGKWVTCYHDREYRKTGLLKDFQHDLWLQLIDKPEINLLFIKKHCFHYPRNAIRYRYYKRGKDFTRREIVLIDKEGEVVTDFPDNYFNPEYEFPPPPKPQKKKHKDTRRVSVLYRNGTREELESVGDLAALIGIDKRSVYRNIGKPMNQRYTKRKMSHITLIEYA